MNLKALRKKHNLTQAELADYLDVSRSTVAMWESGKSEPDLQSVDKIANIFSITSDELLERTSAQKRPVTPSGVRIPVYGEVAAGIPILAIENFDNDNPDDWEEISEDMARSGEYFALRIKGDSMEPKISKGDIVIVRMQPDIETGDIAIVCVNGDEATCKKIKKTPDGIMLISTNPTFEPMFYNAKQIEDLPVRIIGKVVELRAKF